MRGGKEKGSSVLGRQNVKKRNRLSGGKKGKNAKGRNCHNGPSKRKKKKPAATERKPQGFKALKPREKKEGTPQRVFMNMHTPKTKAL